MNSNSGQKSKSLRQHFGDFLFYMVASVFVLAVLLLNEVVLRYIFGMSALNIDIRHLYPYILLPMGLLLIGSKRVMLWSLLVITILQIVWFGTYRYFGNVLGPDIILLGLHQLFEIGIAATGDW